MPRTSNIPTIACLLTVAVATFMFPVHAPGTPGNPGSNVPGNAVADAKAKPQANKPASPTTQPAAASTSATPKPANKPGMNLTPQQITTAIQILREQNPELAQRIDEALERNQDQVRNLISANWPKLAKLVELKQRDPKLFDLTMEDIKLTRQALELAKKIHQAGPDPGHTKTGPQREELRNLVTKRFENRQNIRQLEIENLQKRITDIRQTIEARNRIRDELVRKRVEELANTGKDTPGEF